MTIHELPDVFESSAESRNNAPEIVIILNKIIMY